MKFSIVLKKYAQLLADVSAIKNTIHNWKTNITWKRKTLDDGYGYTYKFMLISLTMGPVCLAMGFLFVVSFSWWDLVELCLKDKQQFIVK
jgi:hypothetical protein